MENSYVVSSQTFWLKGTFLRDSWILINSLTEFILYVDSPVWGECKVFNFVGDPIFRILYYLNLSLLYKKKLSATGKYLLSQEKLTVTGRNDSEKQCNYSHKKEFSANEKNKFHRKDFCCLWKYILTQEETSRHRKQFNVIGTNNIC